MVYPGTWQMPYELSALLRKSDTNQKTYKTLLLLGKSYTGSTAMQKLRYCRLLILVLKLPGITWKNIYE